MSRAGDCPTAVHSLDRRQFLRLSALGAPLVGRSFGVQRARRSAGDPVVVVGAGLAGLRAAGVLQKAGQRVVVLEARAFPGGRVQTVRTPFSEDLYAEAGPIRIPGLHQTVLQLAREHGLSLVPFAPTAGASLISVRGIVAQGPDAIRQASAALALKADEAGLGQGGLLQRYVTELPGDIATLAPTAASYSGWQALDRVTWPEWLRSRGASPDAVTLMTLGGDSRDLSALYVLRQFALLQGTDQFFKIQGGMDQLPRAMAATLGPAVRYNSAVVRIERGPGPIRLHYLSNGRAATISATQVIVTVPFSTLRRIVVQPPFPAPKARAIGTLPYFPATRFLLHSKRRFWEDAGLTGTARTDQPAETWDCTYDVPATAGILGATVGGALGTSIAGMTRPKAVAFGTELVAKTFPDLRANLLSSSVYRWAHDPWSRGAFAVFHPGQMSALMPEIARSDGRVHFAGEHTSPWMGWMEGALESGDRAASEVLGQPATGAGALS